MKGTIEVEKGTWIKESWKVCICVNEIVFAQIKRSNICVWIKMNGKKSHHHWNIRVIIAKRFFFFLQSFVLPLYNLVVLICTHQTWKIEVNSFNENPKYYDVKPINTAYSRAGKKQNKRNWSWRKSKRAKNILLCVAGSRTKWKMIKMKKPTKSYWDNWKYSMR